MVPRSGVPILRVLTADHDAWEACASGAPHSITRGTGGIPRGTGADFDVRSLVQGDRALLLLFSGVGPIGLSMAADSYDSVLVGRGTRPAGEWSFNSLAAHGSNRSPKLCVSRRGDRIGLSESIRP